jgi:hypothetical protein
MENATVVLGGYNTAETLVFYIESMLLTALGLAFFFNFADRESRISLRTFISDLMVRWGVAGLGLFTLVLIFWGLYEIGLQRGLFHFLPWVGIAEYGIWGVAMAGIITLLFYAGALFLNALIRAPTTVKVVRTPYYPYLEEYAMYLWRWHEYYNRYGYGQYQETEAVAPEQQQKR